MNLEDEMAFCMQVYEPEKSRDVKLEEAFPNASGCTMQSIPVTSKAKQEIADIFKIQEQMFDGLKGTSQTESKVSDEKKNKFLKKKPLKEASILVHREVIEKFQLMDREEQRIVLKILIDIF